MSVITITQRDTRVDIEGATDGVLVMPLSAADTATLSSVGKDISGEGILIKVPRGTIATVSHRFALTASAQLSLVLIVEGELIYVQDVGARSPQFVHKEYLSVRGGTLTFMHLSDTKAGSSIEVARIAVVDKDGTIRWLTAATGAGTSLIDQTTRLQGTGASAEDITIFAGNALDRIQLNSVMLHAAPHTRADVSIKGVLDGQSRCRSEGLIKILPAAQATQSYLADHALLLSPDAKADAIPSLEIEANDVKASHGASVRPIAADQMFYLRARGLDERGARKMIVEGFLAPAWAKAWVPEDVRSLIAERISAKFAG